MIVRKAQSARSAHSPLAWILLAGLIAVFLPCTVASAEELPAASSCGHREPGDTRPRIGLVLGGGGARGVAHVGVIRMLEELHVPVDCIAGTSMGALAGGLYASGMSVDDMEELVVSTDWPRIFNDSIGRVDRSYREKLDDRDGLTTVGVGIGDNKVKLSPGLLQGQRILTMFQRETAAVGGISDFDLLPIPFRAVATDLNTGEAVVLSSGNLAFAMRASMSLPGIFQPALLDGKVLLDGGLADQLPVDVVRSMGADIVIAVDVGTPLLKLDDNASLLDVVSQISGMMTVSNTRRQIDSLTGEDILIVPPLGEKVATADFDKSREALAIGLAAAEEARDRLSRLSVPAPAYERWVRSRPEIPDQMPVVDFVRLDNQTGYSDEVILSEIQVPLGEPLDMEQIEDGLLRTYGRGTLSSVTYEVVREEGRSGVLIKAREKPQGPNYLQLGLSVSSNFDSDSQSNLRAALLFSPLSPMGAEGRISAAIGSEPELKGEYFRPLDPKSTNLIYTSAGYFNPDIPVYDANGNNTSVYDVGIYSVEARVAHEFSNYGVLSFGLRRSAGNGSVQIGDPTLEDFDFDQGTAQVSFVIDQVDSLYFPRNGYYASLGYSMSREWLGGDSNFDQMDFDAFGATSFGRHAIQYGARYHVTTSGVAPIQSLYRLGGLYRLAGFKFNELTGQNYAMLIGGYSYQLAEFFGRSATFGGSIEYGNAWQQRSDMGFDNALLNASVFAGFDSWLGPMLFGIGLREGGEQVLFLDIGRSF
ncbi:patatin-like phospholipase family protein [Dokdonella sp.]|uniref:patatin-like phospholipase family protein n=1 Tax=Dokdonella sp. TaxID=2291710 RepID=UPI003529BBCE